MLLWLLFIAGMAVIGASIGLYVYLEPTLFNRLSIGLISSAAFGTLCLLLTRNGIWSSRIGKLRIRDKMMGCIAWQGDETILDVGCGRGLILIEAAKRLPRSRAMGVDTRQHNLEYSNSPQIALRNALIEGMADRIELQEADVVSLPFPDQMFDKVFSSLMLHHAGDAQRAVNEMTRVLKPGGELVIVDVTAQKFIPALEQNGLKILKNIPATRLFLLPTRMILAKNPVFELEVLLAFIGVHSRSLAVKVFGLNKKIILAFIRVH